MAHVFNNGGLFFQAKDNKEVLDGLMNDVDYIDVTASRFPYIGTCGLGACSVALIVSSLGSILAHVAPLSPDLTDGDQHMTEMMESQVDI